MTVHRIPIMGGMTVPDATGETYLQPVDVAMTLGTFAGSNMVMTLKDPSADTGFFGSFMIPHNFASAAKIVVAGILDFTTGGNLQLGVQYVSLADNEAMDVAYVDNDTAVIDSTAYTTEDIVIASISLTDLDFEIGEVVQYFFRREFTADTHVGDFHVTGLYFQYED